MKPFTRILTVDYPATVNCDEQGLNPEFRVEFSADGVIPFPQVILHGQGQQKLIRDDLITQTPETDGLSVRCRARIPVGLVSAGDIAIQIEGCRVADLTRATGEDWIKHFGHIRVLPCPDSDRPARVETGRVHEGVTVYFGIHKHMHQPYYDSVDCEAWDGEKDAIFGSRVGNYTTFIADAVSQYVAGELPHAGLSTSWSGSLIEQLDRCAQRGWCQGRFGDWSQSLRQIAGQRTRNGYPRTLFTAFGYFHPLMPLIPAQDIVRQIEWHRSLIQDSFGIPASRILFPPETAFHVRMIPALQKAGITAVIYDSIHRFRATRDYPYGGREEGLLPPNLAEQVNPPVDDWLQLHNIWAASKISPSQLKPEYVGYEDPCGQVHKIIAIPAERYIGNEDARGGFGALQYPDVLGQVYEQVVRSGRFDPEHPPFFLLHSDGDNHGGGADSYYRHNTGELVEWLKRDKRFELSGMEDYLARFPPDASRVVHIEPGSWSGADNGDPQFMKWFSRLDQPYSPDLNSWAVLTALQNMVHTLEATCPDYPELPTIIRLLLTAETSCYWYWTGQTVWDQQVTQAANQAYEKMKGVLGALVANARETTGPTLFPPWVTPLNPGGLQWGSGGLVAAPETGTVHTFVYDISGIRRVDLKVDHEGRCQTLPMHLMGRYPSTTGAAVTADYYTLELPRKAGMVRFYLEAEDGRGNVSQSSLEQIYLG